jgi:hypothetical protein
LVGVDEAATGLGDTVTTCVGVLVAVDMVTVVITVGVAGVAVPHGKSVIDSMLFR